jgi:hypothetical protein
MPITNSTKYMTWLWPNKSACIEDLNNKLQINLLKEGWCFAQQKQVLPINYLP